MPKPCVSICLFIRITPKRILFFSGDGSIDEEEFKSLCVSYGLNAQDSVEAYNKFTSVCTNSLINKYIHTHMHICTYTHAHVHIHTHMHT
jgi:ATP-dependent protease HslVU (ClpYQ) peptidase subunit